MCCTVLSHSVMSNSATPWIVAHQAPLSVGFSRQEYWNGLPCPPPGDLPNPGVKSGSPTLLADSLPSEPPGKPKNTGVSNLTLLQGVFLTHKSNWDLLHCRWILYQLSYQGRPRAIMLLLLLLSHFSRVRLCATPWTVALQALLSMGFSRQDTGEGCHALLQGIFPTQGSNPDLLHCRQIPYHLSHQGSPTAPNQW